VIVGTGAGLIEGILPFEVCRQRIASDEGTMLILFGTGWGLVDDVMEGCDHLLPGVAAVTERAGYNHLSVRAAVAIILDRLAGDRLDDPA
jgi:hypothetical protein